MQTRIFVSEPNGLIKSYPLKNAMIVGRSPKVEVTCNDLKIPERAVMVQLRDSKPWIKKLAHIDLFLGDLPIGESQLPLDVRARLGDTEIWIASLEEEIANPKIPRRAKEWKTTTPSGRKALWDARKAADTSLSVYLQGETGTGKELFSKLIHYWSSRKAGSFIPLHCAAIPAGLVESELFGHEKGAFTGAIRSRLGALAQAHMGTLFLDEVGDLPLDVQVKLLRFLEDGEIRPLGSNRVHHANVRIICATHKNLEALAKKGRFRLDLYYRLASIKISIPSLRERSDDIGYLADAFAKPYKKTISEKASLRLKTYRWPGNVRELRHAIERACGLAGPFHPILSDDDFQFLTERTGDVLTAQEVLDTSVTLKELQRQQLIRALKISKGHRGEAAKILGIARSTVFEMIKRFGLPRFRDLKKAA